VQGGVGETKERLYMNNEQETMMYKISRQEL